MSSPTSPALRCVSVLFFSAFKNVIGHNGKKRDHCNNKYTCNFCHKRDQIKQIYTIPHMCNLLLLIADVVQEGSNKKSISLSDIWDMLNKISLKLDKHIADSEVRFNRIEEQLQAH
jgi:hypothetical protein